MTGCLVWFGMVVAWTQSVYLVKVGRGYLLQCGLLVLRCSNLSYMVPLAGTLFLSAVVAIYALSLVAGTYYVLGAVVQVCVWVDILPACYQPPYTQSPLQ